MLPREHFPPRLFHAAEDPIGLFTDDGVALGVGVASSEERSGSLPTCLGQDRHLRRDAGRQIHLVRAHCGLGIGVRRDHLYAATLLAQGLDLARKVRAPVIHADPRTGRR